MKSLAAALISSLCFLAGSASAATRTWTGTTSGQWTVASNWGGTAPVNAGAGDDLQFMATLNGNAMNNDFAPALAANSLSFPTAGTFKVSGNGVAVGAGGITTVTGVNVTLQLPLTVSSAQTWTLNGTIGDLVSIDGALTANNSLTFAGTKTLRFDQAVSGTGAVNATGQIIVTVNGPWLATGAIDVRDSAILELASANTVEAPITVEGNATLNITPFNPTTAATSVTIATGSHFQPFFFDATHTSILLVNSGTVTLGGHLDLLKEVGFSVPVGTAVTIIRNNTGTATVGTFAGLAEGGTLTAGAQTFKISYAGGASGHDVTLTPLTAMPATTTTLVSSLNPSNAGNTVTLTATVSPAATGHVTFFDGANFLGQVTLNASSQSAFATTGLTAGTHNLTATYDGDFTHATSTSNIVVQVVNAAAPPPPPPSSIPALDPRSLAALVAVLAVIGVIALKR